MKEKPNILVVCGKNKRRSRTAEYIFKNDMRFNIRSAGLSPKSDHVLNEKDLQWASLVFVMENGQKTRIVEGYRHLDIPKIEVLKIMDEYEYLDESLIEILEEKINKKMQILFKI